MPELVEMVLEMENMHLEQCDAPDDHGKEGSFGLSLWSWAVWRSQSLHVPQIFWAEGNNQFIFKNISEK